VTGQQRTARATTATREDDRWDTISNLARSHREHELFYSRAPLEVAVRMQTWSRALKALGVRWRSLQPATQADEPAAAGLRRYAGCTDLNDETAIQALGILFMEGEGEPAELAKLRRDLAALAEEHEQGGTWLREAMDGSWTAASSLIGVRPLADVLGDRHRIIINNWRMAHASELIACLLLRAADLLAATELNPPAIRADLATVALTPGHLLAAAELLDAASELSTEAGLRVLDSEPRWRRFSDRVETLAAAGAPSEVARRRPVAIEEVD
jgi:hypothetical protein